MNWFAIAMWVFVALHLGIVYLDYNSSNAGYKAHPDTVYETIPLTLWFQNHMGKWWGLGTAAVQESLLCGGAYLASRQGNGAELGFTVGLVLMQAYYYYSIILPNYKLAR